jgi:NAD(P)-dependent dehydrogenase (short-subunit alcohol dehydrogenase family)
VSSPGAGLAVVTGAHTSGGGAIVEQLAATGTEVVMAVPSLARGTRARDEILARRPGARLRLASLDPSDLASVQAFADGLIADGRPIDLLVNHARVKNAQGRKTTRDGFELHLGMNVLGTFALTLRLIPAMLRAASPRVVTIANPIAIVGRIQFDDLHLTRRYTPSRAYAQSQLAELMFAVELAHKATRWGWNLRSVAAHSSSALARHTMAGPDAVMYAVTNAAAVNGQYYRGAIWSGQRKPPTPSGLPRAARDPVARNRLWTAARQETGVHLPVE